MASPATLSQQQELSLFGILAGDFGWSVAVSGDTALVGAPLFGLDNSGAAFVFVRSNATWSLQQKLVASDPGADDWLGWSVALQGDTAVIGAYHKYETFADQGAAYVFVRSGTTWTQQQKLVAPDGALDDFFGWSVALAGDTTVIGARYKNTGQGAAYVYVRSGSTWSLQQKLLAPDPSASDRFGTAVSVSGDTAVVGASEKASNQGAAYVFVRSGTLWTHQQKLAASDAAPASYFGESVAISSTTLVVGAYGADSDRGAAYVFERAGGAWAQQQKLVAADGLTGDRFGLSVSLSGNRTVVGGESAEAAYLFLRSGTSWTLQQKLVALDGQSATGLGWSVSLSDDTVLVSRSSYDTVVAFASPAPPPTAQRQELEASDPAPDERFAFAVSVAQDTAVVGAPYDGNGRGAAYVFVRSGGAWSQQQKLQASDGVPGTGFGSGDLFGWSVSVAGDTAVVGAWMKDSKQGAAYVFVRSGSTWTEQQKLVASDGMANDYFGHAVSVSAATVLVGAYNKDSGRGAAYVYVRAGSTWTEQQKLTAYSGAASDYFGYDLAVAGETAIVGAWGSGSAKGTVVTFDRIPGVAYLPWVEGTTLTASDGASGDYFGESVSLSGDTALIGAWGQNSNRGAAYVFSRSWSGWTQQQKLLAPQGAAGDYFGRSLCVSGDTAVLGAPGSQSEKGAVHVFTRSGATWTARRPLVGAGLAGGSGTGDYFGGSIGLSGDSAFVGANGRNTAAGRAFVFTSTKRRPLDFGGDGKADLAVFHAATGLWYIRDSSTGDTQALGFGLSGDKTVPRDYDGDGRTDVAVYNPPSGLWYVRPSTTLTTYPVGYGGSSYAPVPTDYDGDDLADLAVFHDPTGLWFLRLSSTGATQSLGYGASGYVPVPGDYDGDGRADVAVYHPPTGIWYVRSSSTGATQASGFGGADYAPVPQDYDGDGRFDLAVFHAASGLWFIRLSTTGATQAVGYGGNGYIPVPADYDGDGLADITVYHPPSGLWFVRSSGTGTTTATGFGGPGYLPAR